MQIVAGKDGEYQLKTKQTTVSVDGTIAIGDRVLPGPGEYESGGVFAEITPDIAHFHVEEMVIVYLGHKKRAVTEAELEHLENVDVLLVSVDSEAKDELTAITKLIKEIEPRIVLLVGIENAEAFTKVDGEVPEIISNLKLTRADLPEEDRKMYLLKS